MMYHGAQSRAVDLLRLQVHDEEAVEFRATVGPSIQRFHVKDELIAVDRRIIA